MSYVMLWYRKGPANYVGSLMDYVARGYSPALGRFVSADTIVPGAGNPAAFNRYMYVRGNPLKLIDPTGHRPADDDSDDGVPSDDMPMKSVCVPDYCVLDPAYDATIKKYAEAFGIPEALLRTTQLVEAQDDQEWYSGLANGVISRYSEYADSGSVLQPLANLSLGLIEGYFRARHADNGIGMENVHVQPASDAEKYFSANYPGTEMARLVAPGKNMAQMLKSLKTVEGNTMYAAAILRELADQRTGKSGSHVDSLSVVDEAIIYGAYRSGIGSYPKESGGFTGASVPGGFGNTYLRYRNLGPTRPSNGPN